MKRTHALVIFACAVFVVAVGAVSWWRVAQRPAVEEIARRTPILSPELEAVVNTNAQPASFSRELEPVLAAIPEAWRRRIILQIEDPQARLLRARCSACGFLSSDMFHGDAMEVEPALDYFEQVPRREPAEPEIEAERRVGALCILFHALRSGAAYSVEIINGMQRIAIKYFDWYIGPSDIFVRRYSLGILALLHAQGMLDAEVSSEYEARMADEGFAKTARYYLTQLGVEAR